MKLNRDIALKIHYVFDQLIPPIFRDSKFFMSIFIKMAFRHRAPVYLDFKEKAYEMSEEEFREAYRLTSDVAFERPTDLNRVSIEKIIKNIKGNKILEVGCGGGYLANLLSKDFSVTAVDILLQEGIREKIKNVNFQEINIERLPFADNDFDTVISTHTLEHVRNLNKAVSELRRVAKTMIIVVPRQRSYLYTFDLHLNFFPYLHSFQSAIGKNGSNFICEDADGDIFYLENK